MHTCDTGYSRLSANLKANATLGGLGVIDRLGTGLNVGADTVVVARREGVEVAETVDGDSVLGRAVANGRRVPADLAVLDVVRCLSTDEEAVPAEDSVRGEVRALQSPVRSYAKVVGT